MARDAPGLAGAAADFTGRSNRLICRTAVGAVLAACSRSRIALASASSRVRAPRWRREQEPSHPGAIISSGTSEEDAMNGLIYLVGLIVVIMAILSLFGLR